MWTKWMETSNDFNTSFYTHLEGHTLYYWKREVYSWVLLINNKIRVRIMQFDIEDSELKILEEANKLIEKHDKNTVFINMCN